ncbi:hypothetical protein EIN_251370, partial [Entamoeba invadens IP1]
MYLRFHILIFVVVVRALIINTPCVPQMYVIDEDVMFEHEAMGEFADVVSLHKCYEEMGELRKNVYGVRVKAECYVYSTQMHIHTERRNISRCGHCMSLVGPSLIATQCMIAGYYTVDEQYATAMNAEGRLSYIVFLNKESVKRMSSGTAFKATEATASYTSCNYATFPVLTVLATNSTHTKLVVYNTNERVVSISNGTVSSDIDGDGYFTLQTAENRTIEKVCVTSFEGQRTCFSAVTTTPRNTYVALSRYTPPLENKTCEFLPQLIAFSTTTNYSFVSAPFRYKIAALHLTPPINSN